MKIYKRKTNEGHVSIFRFECVYEPISSKRMKIKLSQNLRLTHSQANVLSSVERITCTVYFGCFRSQRRRRQRREQRHTNWCANRLIFIFDIGYTLLWLFLLIMWSIRVYALLVFFLFAILSFIIYCMEWKLKSNHAIFHETGKLLFRHYHHRHHSVKSWGIKVGNIGVACPRFL